MKWVNRFFDNGLQTIVNGRIVHLSFSVVLRLMFVVLSLLIPKS